MPYKLRTLTEATPTVAGLLSAADKEKLDGLRAGYYPERVPNFGLVAYSAVDVPVGDAYEADADLIDMAREGVTPAVLRQCEEEGTRLRCGCDWLVDVFLEDADEEERARMKELLTFDLGVQISEDREDGSTFYCVSDPHNVLNENVAAAFPPAAVVVTFDAEGAMTGVKFYRVYPMLTENQYKACTNTVGSTNGLCPALPSTDSTEKFLRSDGTWAAVPQPDEATTEAAGLMSAADKQKLDALEAEVVTFTSSDPLPYVATEDTSFEPTTYFPFSGEDAEWKIRGVTKGKNASCLSSDGTFSYTVASGMVMARIEVWGTASMPYHICRIRNGSCTQSGSSWSITWMFPWYTPSEE